MSARRSILLQLAHPALERSRINRRLLDEAATIACVTVNDLYEHYPDFDIDVAREQRLLAEADVIVFQHPVLWYSLPALLRQWQDLVLESGFAYGRGCALKDKWAMHCLSTGGLGSDYRAGSVHGAALTEFLRPHEQTIRFCRMHYLPPFVVHGARTFENDEELAAVAQDYARLLRDIANPALSLERLSEGPYINTETCHG